MHQEIGFALGKGKPAVALVVPAVAVIALVLPVAHASSQASSGRETAR